MLKLNYLTILLLMFFSGLFVYCFNQKHLLLILLSLEFIVVSMFMYLMYYLINFSFEMYLSMYFLTLSVCEGALGLSLLVSVIRSYGNDYYQSFSIF